MEWFLGLVAQDWKWDGHLDLLGRKIMLQDSREDRDEPLPLPPVQVNLHAEALLLLRFLREVCSPIDQTTAPSQDPPEVGFQIFHPVHKNLCGD